MTYKETEILSNNKFLYRASEHNSIINSILEGDYNKTIANIDRILITNAVNDVTAEDMKMLYQNIINTIITAFKMKKIDDFDTQIQSDELAEIINYNDQFEDPRYQDEE